jgi:hypothetical protein
VAHDNFGLLLDMGNFLCADRITSGGVWQTRTIRLPRARQRLLCAGWRVAQPGQGLVPIHAPDII